MSRSIVLSVDAMGGDHAPASVIAGVDQFAAAHPGARFQLHGQAEALAPLLAAHPRAAAVSSVVDCPDVIPMDMKPAVAMRKRHSSMFSALAAVKDGSAQAAVSAGNTGALMAMALLQLRTLEGCHRPALAAQWPTLHGRAIVLDVGANADSDPEQLIDFAIMGEAFARAMLGIARPSVGLLNIGSEDQKGHDDIREAMRLLRQHGASLEMNVHGFVEGNDISMGTTDVVVTDGFTGNVALKAAEGAAKLVGSFIRDAIKSGPFSMLGALIASQGLKGLKDRMDPRKVNGGVFLGLNGLVVKAHGGSDAVGFDAALGVAHQLAASSYNDDVRASLARLAAARAAATSAPAADPAVSDAADAAN
jgi:glycerol-3-phosphate acyltransferase PlsX